MDINGEYLIDAPREVVWRALNDPEMLQQCIPGCDSLQQIDDNRFTASITATIGPVRAKFNTTLSLEDLDPPAAYRLVGESKGGAAGFGRGSALVELDEQGGGTRLRYTADFKVGGKLAQVGSRLVLGATRKMADEFFASFSEAMQPGTPADAAGRQKAKATFSPATWLALAGAAGVLLICWFLLR